MALDKDKTEKEWQHEIDILKKERQDANDRSYQLSGAINDLIDRWSIANGSIHPKHRRKVS